MPKSLTRFQPLKQKKIRYAVVGLGFFAQASVLPSFSRVGRNSELTALVSGDGAKLKKLAKKYELQLTSYYDQFEDCLNNPEIDAVYLVLPNHLHCEYAIRAAKMGKHILVEKPMAVTEKECEAMIAAAAENRVQIMVGYRLHTDQANLYAIEMIKSGKIGEPRFFNSIFSMQVADKNIRLAAEGGSGPLFDLGIYCINASRYLFQDEPLEVFAISEKHEKDIRFKNVDEMITVNLRFPKNRLATFTCSFGGADCAQYNIVGTKGNLFLNPCYEHSEKAVLEITVNGKKQIKKFSIHDQIAGEITYFSECLLNGSEPEPSGQEGMADIRIVEHILQSLKTGSSISLKPISKRERPNMDMKMLRPPAIHPPKLYHASAPTK